MQTATNSSILALDVGERRIGIAVASRVAKLASPVGFIENDETVYAKVQQLIAEHQADELVVGYPRNMSGDPTAQTEYVEAFVATLSSHIPLPIALQDESLTSHRAEHELQARGKPYAKGDIDALAATYILEDYLKQGGE
jgi:putative holliday junction resolvase